MTQVEIRNRSSWSATRYSARECGSREDGGRFDGVAPEATLLSASTSFHAVELTLIYGRLLAGRKKGLFPGGLVVSNSFGLKTCVAPVGIPGDHPYIESIRRCVSEGIVMVFAAGNNHAAECCNYPADADEPNTIWTINSLDEVITVGTVDREESNRSGGEHANSSRGPGQWSTRKDKPDVVAPTYGLVPWGADDLSFPWWGTSGACPQVAGLAALLLSVRSNLTPEQIRLIIQAKYKKVEGSSHVRRRRAHRLRRSPHASQQNRQLTGG